MELIQEYRMLILGQEAFHADASACLIESGKRVLITKEERLRRKQDRSATYLKKPFTPSSDDVQGFRTELSDIR